MIKLYIIFIIFYNKFEKFYLVIIFYHIEIFINNHLL